MKTVNKKINSKKIKQLAKDRQKAKIWSIRVILLMLIAFIITIGIIAGPLFNFAKYM